MVAMGPKRVRLTGESKLKKYKYFLRMNWRYEGSLNPVLVRLLRQTTRAAAFSHVVIDKLDAFGNEVSLRAADEAEPGAVKLEWSGSETSAVLLLSLVTAEWPALKVPKGRLRTIPVEFREDEELPYLVLNLKESFVEIAPKLKKSGGGAVEGGSGEQAAAGKQAEQVVGEQEAGK
jgi:hypothetical protein